MLKNIKRTTNFLFSCFAGTKEPGPLSASDPEDMLNRSKAMENHGRSPSCGADCLFCSISLSYCAQTSFHLLEVMHCMCFKL
jgi:hypothetical protein